MDVDKQKAGFRFGKYSLTVLETLGEVKFSGRSYRAVTVLTNDGKRYVSLRLYNGNGRFIKQLLMEPEIVGSIGSLLMGIRRCVDGFDQGRAGQD